MSATAVLIGAPGAGKTRTAKRVARALGIEHIDTDKRFVAEHGPIAEFFTTHGEPEFRRIERQLVAEAVATDAIVSLGGGAVLDEGTQQLLATLPVIQLTSSVEAIKERIEREPAEATKRPLLANGGVEAWVALVEARRPIYERLATVTIDTSHRTFEAVAQEVIQWLQSR